MQEYKLTEQVKAYRRTYGSTPPQEKDKLDESNMRTTSAKKNASQVIPDDVLNRIKKRHSDQYPDNYSMQKIMADADVKAYKELKGYSDQNVPKDIIIRIIRKNYNAYPDNYSMQKIMVDADMKAYKDLH
jgi:hypothetical protein